MREISAKIKMYRKRKAGSGVLTPEEFHQVIRWLSVVGVSTVGDFALFVRRYTDGTAVDIMNKANGCFVYEISLM